MSYLSDLELIQEIDDLTPVFSRNFAANPVLNPEIAGEITFTRASTSTRTNELGLISDAGVDVPRFDYTPNLRTNKLLYSQEFDNSLWGKVNISVTPNATIAPDSTTTAESVTETVTNDAHQLNQSFSGGFGLRTFSVYAKPNGRDWLILNLFNGVNHRAWFNVSTGVVGTLEAGITASIVSVGNGWYRCSMTYTDTVTVCVIGVSNADNVTTYSGTVGLGLFIWGAQLEIGAVSPYQATPNTIAGPVCKGLLIEEARTNLLLRSEEFGNAFWSNNSTSVTANSAIAPDGTTTADSLIANTNNVPHFIFPTATAITSGVAYTLTIFAKANQYPALGLVFVSSGFGTNTFANFDLVNGLCQVTGAAGASVAISNQGGGWYRCQLTATATATTNTHPQIRVVNSYTSGDGQFIGDNVSGIYIWGAQLEAGAFPTSYIRTTSAAVTRAQDVCSVTGTNFSRWFRRDEGTLFGDFSSVGTTGSKFNALFLYDMGRSAIMQTGDAAGASRSRIQTVGFVDQLNINYSTFANKKLIAYKTNDSVAGFEGTVAIDTACQIPENIDILMIGYNQVGSQGAAGHFRSIAYYPKRLSNRLLKAITLP